MPDGERSRDRYLGETASAARSLAGATADVRARDADVFQLMRRQGLEFAERLAVAAPAPGPVDQGVHPFRHGLLIFLLSSRHISLRRWILRCNKRMAGLPRSKAAFIQNSHAWEARKPAGYFFGAIRKSGPC